MKKIIMILIFLMIMLFAGFSQALTAGGLDQVYLNPDVKWLVHMDFDLFNNTRFKQLILENDHFFKLKRKQKSIYKEIQIDIFKDISSVTMFGSKKDEFVFQISGNLNRDHVLNRFKKEADPKIIKFKNFEIYEWHHGNFAVFVDPGNVLYSRSYSTLTSVLSNLKHRSKGKFQGDRLDNFLKMAPKNAFFLAVTADMSAFAKRMPDLGNKGFIMSSTGFASFLSMENDDIISLKAMLNFNSNKTATQIESIIKGLIAMVQLKAHEHPLLGECVQALKLNVRDKRIMMDLSYPSEGFVKVLLGLDH